MSCNYVNKPIESRKDQNAVSFFFHNSVAFILLTACGMLSTHLHAKGMHEHQDREVSGYAIPSVKLLLEQDPMDGINLHLDTENYVLNSPLSEKETAQYLQGHAHLFLNGVKRFRLYGEDFHIPYAWLKEGENKIEVSLNSHMHENWTVKGKPIMDTVMFDLE